MIQLTLISKLFIDAGSVSYWVGYLIKIQNRLLSSIGKIPSNTEKENEEIISSIMDIMCCAYMNIMIEIIRGLPNFDPEKEFQKAKAVKKYSKCRFANNKYLNNLDCERMCRHIEAEYAIERKRITPNWFIEQTVAYQIYKSLGEVIDIIIRILNEIFGLGKQLYDNKHIYSAAVVFSHCVEMESKCEIFISGFRNVFLALEEKHFESSIIWEKVSLDYLEKELNSIETETPSYLSKCCGAFALDHWEKREKSPDFLGFCYNHLCEHLLRAIETDDIKKFEAIYIDFFSVVLLYQEYVRTSVVKRKEEYMQNIVFHVLTSPFVEYGIISGLAIIWGEFTGNTHWEALIEATLKHFIDEAPEKHKKVIQSITKSVEVGRHGNWGQDFYKIKPPEDLLRDLLLFEDHQFLEYDMDNLLANIMQDLVCFGKAYLEIVTWRDTEGVIQGVSFALIKPVVVLRGINRTSFVSVQFNKELKLYHIENKNLIVLRIKDLGYSRYSLRKLLRKINKYDFTNVGNMSLYPQKTGFDFKEYTRKSEFALLKATRNVYWYGRNSRNQHMSESYLLYRAAKFVMLRKEFLNYII